MDSRSPMTARVDRRRLVLASGGAILAAPLLGRMGASAQDSIVATMITDTAGIGDESFNDLAKAGGERAAEELGIEFNVLESQTAADYVPNLISAVEQGDLAVAVGFLIQDAVAEVAPQYPDKFFALIDAVVEEDNVVSYVFREQEGSFLAGALAALTTTTGIIGYLGGIRVPPVMRYEVGYIAGAKSINPDVKVLISYADDFEDPALGKELTLAQYNNNADIVLAAAGRTGIGAFDAAKEKGQGFFVIAADQDQSELGAEFQLAVVIKKLDTGVYDACKMVLEGAFEGGAHDIGIAEDGMGIDNFQADISQDVRDTIEAYSAAIADGTIVPPVDDETLAAFKPVPPAEVGGSATPSASPAASPIS